MYSRILVISDNLRLCQRVDYLFNAKDFDHVSWSFGLSPGTDLNLFRNTLPRDFITVDMKNDATVERIISDFDLVISIHCKQLFPAKLINRVKCINVHPGYNPINRGWYPQVFAIIHGWEIGATIHEIDETMDHGPIIDRELVEKFIEDNSEQLYDRILNKEIELLSRNIEKIVNGNYETFLPEGEGNLFLKKDFNALCEINLDETVKAGEFIRKLQALTHGDYKNAYFIHPEDNRKYYIEIRIKPDKD